MKTRILILLGSIYILSACVKNNPLPTYLKLSKWDLVKNTDPDAANAGDLTHDFTDAWVYVNNKLIGIFELPCTIPVLEQGANLDVVIYPTIRNNGVSDLKLQYPFCNPFSTKLNFNPGETLTINPVTSYTTSSKFWIEDFEDPSLRLRDDVQFPGTISRENEAKHQLNGGFYGVVQLSLLDSIWRGFSDQKLQLPKGKNIFLEVNYKTEVNILAGIISYAPSPTPISYIYLTNKNGLSAWKKIYIQLNQPISEQINSSQFDLFFQAQHTAGAGNEYIYLDNIKLVY